MVLPIELVESLALAPGFNKEEFVDVHERRESLTSIRFNPLKPVNISSTEFISGNVPWSSGGYYLSQRPFFTFDPLLHAGAYYVQEASSMFLEEAIRQTVDLSRSLTALDLCAAPGGKSTLIQSLLNKESILVSNEVIKTRVTILEENLIKWGGVNRIITNNDPKDFRKFPELFDLVVIDAPCSGSGLFRRDPELVKEWSPGNVEMCSQRQQRILADILPSLKEDGVLIYSTCSYSVEEDEEIADWLISAFGMEPLELNIKEEWNIVKSHTEKGGFGYRFYPDKLKGEGFFISCFRKKQESHDSEGASYSSRKSSKLEKATKNELLLVNEMVNTDGLLCWKLGERILAIPEVQEKLLVELMNGLYIRNAGVSLGKPSAKELIPDHELAMSTICREGIATMELKKEDALQYLRREEVKLDGNLRGWALATFKNLPLGWMKVLPNRINNYYPKEWRILKSAGN
jgi:16S rRNA C967 or C1407 C5-methylase (RsmB/RsmF family)/NOL1/NOP2/fmu family ribosome biogenesis protein